MSNEINHNPANDTPVSRVRYLAEDTEGHARARIEEDEAADTEGHVRAYVAADDAEDTEGHARARIDEDDDTEGHVRF